MPFREDIAQTHAGGAEVTFSTGTGVNGSVSATVGEKGSADLFQAAFDFLGRRRIEHLMGLPVVKTERRDSALGPVEQFSGHRRCAGRHAAIERVEVVSVILQESAEKRQVALRRSHLELVT